MNSNLLSDRTTTTTTRHSTSNNNNDVDAARILSRNISQIVRAGCVKSHPLDGQVVVAHARASLKYPTRPFTPAVFDSFGASPSRKLRPSIPSARSLHPRRLDPLNLTTINKAESTTTTTPDPQSIISSSHESESATATSPSPPHIPIPTTTLATRLSQYKSSKKKNTPTTTNFDFPESDLALSNTNTSHDTVSPFTKDLHTLQHILTSFTSTFHHLHTTAHLPQVLQTLQETLTTVNSLLKRLSYLRTVDQPSNEYPKLVLKKHRDSVVESLMKWMTLSELISDLDSRVQVELAVGVCGFVIRLTRDDRVLGNAFKLLFKLSKGVGNDAAFGRNGVLDGILSYLKHLTLDNRLLIPHKCDMAIYAVATFKNLSSGGGELSFESLLAALPETPPETVPLNSTKQQPQQHESIVIVLSRIMWFLMNHPLPSSTTPLATSQPLAQQKQHRVAQITQLMIQITSTIRNLLSLHPTETHQSLCKEFVFVDAWNETQNAPVVGNKSLEQLRRDHHHRQESTAISPLQILVSAFDSQRFGSTCGESKELMLNVSRILSKASLDPECLRVLRCCSGGGGGSVGKGATGGNVGSIDWIMDTVFQFQNKKPLLLRLLFVLGNISTPPTTESDLESNCDFEEAEFRLLSEFHKYSGDLVALFWKYGKKVLKLLRNEAGELTNVGAGGRYAENDSGLDDSGSSSGEDEESRIEATARIKKKRSSSKSNEKSEDLAVDCEDVLVKIVRLISNMSVYPPTGTEISCMIELELMLDLIELAASLPSHEELVLNLAAALANFTFYGTEDNFLLQRKTEVLELMLPLLLHENHELVEQATRVYSNLCRPLPPSQSQRKESNVPEIQSWMSRHRGGIELLTILIDHPCPQVVTNVCGTLINLFSGGGERDTNNSGAISCGKQLVSCGGVEKLIDLVQDAMAASDLRIAGLGCKALLNLISLDASSSDGMRGGELCFFKEEEELRLGVLMVQYLDVVSPPLVNPPPFVRMQSQQDLFSHSPGENKEEWDLGESQDKKDKETQPGVLSHEEREFMDIAKRVLYLLGCDSADGEVETEEDLELESSGRHQKKEVGV
ncbi:hypothetical protein BDR26DRAFT_860221 [Obelidium mucronatum]|nr:hypothetical protein BDR26DRAFT_860221 [Obelidium mucronatum]